MSSTAADRASVRANRERAEQAVEGGGTPCEWSGQVCLTRAKLRKQVWEASELAAERPSRHAAFRAANKALAEHQCEPPPPVTLADIDDLIDEACKTFGRARAADDDTHDSDYSLARRAVRRAVLRFRSQAATSQAPRSEPEWLEQVRGSVANAVSDWRIDPSCGPPCVCDGDNVALQVLCRAFDDDPADLMEEWRAFDKSGWFWWGRALGVFIRQKTEPPLGTCPSCNETLKLVNPRPWPDMSGTLYDCEECGTSLLVPEDV